MNFFIIYRIIEPGGENVDFKQIEAFINVAKYKSFSKAAEAIFLSQPTISAHIASLEQELNVALFDRHGKEVRLTHAGSLFLEHAINLVNIRNTAIVNISEYENSISGRLSISSSTTPCRFLLPSLVKSFNDTYPDVTFSIKEDNTRNVVEHILSSESDVGIVGEVISDSRLSFEKICSDRLVVISNSSELSKTISLDELLHQRFILREKGSATRNAFEKGLKSKGYTSERLKVFAEVSSLEAVLQFVKSGSGVSIVSEMACQDYISTGLIKKHFINGMDISRDIFIVNHNKRTLPPVAKAFYSHVIENMKEK